MKVTIIYDNTAFSKNLTPDWGFSCPVEAYGRKILFDTGAKGSILLDNMKKLGIDASKVTEIFISHDHRDHTGGLFDFLKKNQVKVYIPESCKTNGDIFVRVNDELEICENIYSTGELDNIEHSLVVREENNVAVITGCSHPGVEKILEKASQFGEVKTLIGGLHGFKNFLVAKDLNIICPAHCTQHIQKIKELYPDKYVEAGAGRVIK